MLLRQIVKGLASEYDGSSRAVKTQMELLVKQVKEKGSRFLKRSTLVKDFWEMMSDEAARSKIARLFETYAAPRRHLLEIANIL
eukprot:scaffold6708_cov134-Cylindrotheca_fusiformis.AAC.5